jgi:hypothetical protein
MLAVVIQGMMKAKGIVTLTFAPHVGVVAVKTAVVTVRPKA